jgi:hypothetical protein
MPLHQSPRPPAVGSCGKCRLRRSSSAWTPVTSSRLGTSTSGRCPVDAWCLSSHDLATAEVSADPAGSFSTPANAGLRAVLRHMTVMRLPFVVAEATTLDIATPQVVQSRHGGRAVLPKVRPKVRDRLRLVCEGLWPAGQAARRGLRGPSRFTPAATGVPCGASGGRGAPRPHLGAVGRSARASSVRRASKPKNSSIRPGDWCGGRQPLVDQQARGRVRSSCGMSPSSAAARAAGSAQVLPRRVRPHRRLSCG